MAWTSATANRQDASRDLISRGADLRGWLSSLAGVGAFPAVVTAGLRRRSGAVLGWMSPALAAGSGSHAPPTAAWSRTRRRLFFGSSGGPPRTTNYGVSRHGRVAGRRLRSEFPHPFSGNQPSGGPVAIGLAVTVAIATVSRVSLARSATRVAEVFPVVHGKYLISRGPGALLGPV